MTTEKYKCSLCIYETNKKYNLNRHMMAKHKNTVNDKECNKCGKILSSKNYLQKHLLICKGVSNPLECHKILANSSSKAKHFLNVKRKNNRRRKKKKYNK